jgi:hypothetical protein
VAGEKPIESVDADILAAAQDLEQPVAQKGTEATMLVPAVVAKYASLFQGRRYPENRSPS